MININISLLASGTSDILTVSQTSPDASDVVADVTLIICLNISSTVSESTTITLTVFVDQDIAKC